MILYNSRNFYIFGNDRDFERKIPRSLMDFKNKCPRNL